MSRDPKKNMRRRFLITFTAAFIALLLCAGSVSKDNTFRSPPDSELLSHVLHKGIQIEWLHIPKTGTTLGNSLVHWACPELEVAKWVREDRVTLPDGCRSKFKHNPTSRSAWPIGDHYSLENRTDFELRCVFAMVRSPKTKLVSGYHYIQQQKYHNPHHLNASKEEICDFVRNSDWPHASRGAQVKQIAGVKMLRDGEEFHFESPLPPNMEQAKEACRRLRLFGFVGITDYYNASLCLFHAMYGGVTHALELDKIREGEYRYLSSVKEVDCEDTTDAYLYACALELFHERMRKHPECHKALL